MQAKNLPILLKSSRRGRQYPDKPGPRKADLSLIANPGRMEANLSGLLDTLQNEGHLDSRGGFTVEFRKASEKLSLRRLPDARMYVLQLVQAAVSGKHTRIVVETQGRALRFRSYGEPSPASTIENLAGELVASNDGPGHYLAAAVNAAFGLHPEQLHLTTWDGRAGSKLSFVGSDDVLERIDRCPFKDRAAQTQLVVVYPLLQHLRHHWSFEETQHLRSSCYYSPVPIFLNGKRLLPAFGVGSQPTKSRRYDVCVANADRSRMLTGQFHPKHHVLEARRPSSPSEHAFALPASLAGRCLELPGNTPARPHSTGAAAGERIFCAAVAIKADLSPSTLQLIRNGITLQPIELESPFPGVTALLSAEGLSADLTGTAVVEDAAFLDLRNRLDSDIVWLWQQVGNRFHHQGLSFRQQIDRLLCE